MGESSKRDADQLFNSGSDKLEPSRKKSSLEDYSSEVANRYGEEFEGPFQVLMFESGF